MRACVDAATPTGLAVREAVARGNLVPDELLLEIVRPALVTAAARGGCVLDGFPRTVAQDEALRADGLSIQLVVQLHVPEATVVRRMLARGRVDDTAGVIQHRLAVYRSQTVPLLEDYARRQELVLVDGTGTVDEVRSAVVRDMQEWLLRRRLVS